MKYRHMVMAVILTVVATPLTAQTGDVLMRRPIPQDRSRPQQPALLDRCGTIGTPGFASDPGCSKADDPAPPPNSTSPDPNAYMATWTVGKWKGGQACGASGTMTRTVNCSQYRENAQGETVLMTVNDGYCLQYPENGQKPPSTYTGTGGNCRGYGWKYGEYGEWDQQCSYAAKRTRTAVCMLDGAAVDDAMCQHNPVEGEDAVRDERVETGSRFEGCRLFWRYVSAGFQGYHGDPVATGIRQDNDIACRKNVCGQQVSYSYVPARCFIQDPGGNKYESPPPGASGIDLPDGKTAADYQDYQDYQAFGGYRGDANCLAKGMTRPPPLRNAETAKSCGAFSSSTVYSGPTDKVGRQMAVTGQACTGDIIGSYKVSYQRFDSSAASRYCAGMQAGCCTFRGDPNERASDDHERIWTVEAHEGLDWAPANEQNATFSLISVISGSSQSFQPRDVDATPANAGVCLKQ